MEQNYKSSVHHTAIPTLITLKIQLCHKSSMMKITEALTYVSSFLGRDFVFFFLYAPKVVQKNKKEEKNVITKSIEKIKIEKIK